MVTATIDIVQWYSVLCGVFCGYNNSTYSAMLQCCVVVHCGYKNSRYSAIVMCCVWMLLWLQQYI